MNFSMFCQSEHTETSFKAVFYLTDGSVIYGHFIESDPYTTVIKPTFGDTLHIPTLLVKERYRIKDNLIYTSNGRFFYKDGVHIDASMAFGGGASGGFTHIELSVNKRITEKLTLGAGLSNQFEPTSYTISAGNTTNFVFLPHRTTPIFLKGNYYLNSNRRRLFIHGKAGYAIARQSRWGEHRTYNGATFQYGIGLNRSSKKGLRTFIMLSQSHTYAAGELPSWFTDSLDESSTLSEYNLWLNRITFTFGLEINLDQKPKRF